MSQSSLSKKQQMFVIYLVCLGFLGILIIMFTWSANDYYSQGWDQTPRSKIHQQRASRAARSNDSNREKPSKQPRAPGMRESEIKKYHGDGYATY